MFDDIQLHVNSSQGKSFIEKLTKRNFLFSFVISYTETSEIPGITFAGSNKEMIKFTPPADAEYLHYGSCKSIETIPMTPDGKPTPALITKTALEMSSIPNVIINAGSKIEPQMPFIHTGLEYGKNIQHDAAMSQSQVMHAIDYGRIIGRTLGSLTDCLVIGESIPGGTTTASAVMRGLGYEAKVSSSIPKNPVDLKNKISSDALKRLESDDPYHVISQLGDPMIPLVAGMLSTASDVSNVILAGGTQMAAVLTFANKIGFNKDKTAIGTTSYITDDKSANFLDIIEQVGGVPSLSVDPKLENSKFPGLRAFSEGFAKEGVGAGGSIIASMLKSGFAANSFLPKIEDEYHRLFTLQ